ncbi:MAG: hypothetical protein PHE02_10190 [Lachnospiraceae bacterium]|nr:hypothetical protein [Lachnospiraceae bacterium]
MIIDRIIRNIKEHAFSYALLGGSLLFYIFFAFYDGAIICVDSPSYINMSVTREAFYPSLLAFSRFLFGDGELYLFMVILLQSILSAVAAWMLAEYLRKEMGTPHWISVCLLALPLAVSLLNRFAAQRASMYSNSIMTEGIAIALYLVAIREILEFLLYQTRESLRWTCVLAVIMISTRKQMYVILALICLAIIVVSMFNRFSVKSIGRGILKSIIVAVAVLVAVGVYDRGYNYVVRGEVAGHSSDNRFLCTMVYYVAEESDADYIEDPQIRQLFLDIYDVCREKGYLGQSAGEGWYNEVTHFGDYYDSIQIDTMWPMIHDYVDGENEALVENGEYMDREIETDRIMTEMIRAIFPHDYLRIGKVLFNNFLSGLVTTVAQRTPILVWYSIVAYLGYLGVLLYNLRLNKLSKTNIFALLTLVSIIGNVALVSAVIFCQTRYTVYNMPLFYMAGLLMLYELYRTKYKGKKIAD